MDSSSKLGMLQESFAVNTWHKLQDHSYPNAKLMRNTPTIRRLSGGFGRRESHYDVIPKRKVIDIEHELTLSHKRTFTIQCDALEIKAKQLLLNPIEAMIIQLDFMGEKVLSGPIMLASNTTINELRGSLMAEDKYISLPLGEPYQFQFQIAPNQIRQFVHFMNVQYAIFTVWNSSTMFQVGSCRVCLRDYLLQDSNVDNILREDLDITLCSTTYHEEPSSMIQTQSNLSLGETTVNGKLRLSLTHEAMDLSDTANIVKSHSNALLRFQDFKVFGKLVGW